MSKQLLILLLLIGTSLPAFSQGRDTAFAVRKLFRQKRGNGESWAATGATVAADESAGWRSTPRTTSENVRAAAINGGIPLVLGLTKAQRYSTEREAAILKRYAEGWPLPADVRGKLRRKHFHRSKHDVLRP